jgi:tetratricopeptide (TPR) repeat protein
MSAATAAELHRQAVSESANGRHAAAHRLLAAALRSDPTPARRAHILISLAYHVAERRSLAAGLALLDEADAIPDVPRRIHGLAHSQRALLYMRAAQFAAALPEFDAALRLLDESEPEDVGRVLLNRAMVHEQRRNLSQGRADLTRLLDLATRHGLAVLGAKALNNLGRMALIAGDLPQALRLLDAAAGTLRPLSPAIAATWHLDRAQVLLAAGLVSEADADLARSAELFGVSHIRQGQGEAELARAQVALLDERWSDAERLTQQARRRFRRRGAEVWAMLAEFVFLEARVGGGRGLRAAVSAAAQLADRLSGAGLADEARRAALLGATTCLRLGDPAGAREAAGDALRLRRDEPLLTRLQARAVRAGLADAAGRPRRAAAERRAGLRDLQRYQSSLGSLDLQTAVSGYGQGLAEEGLAQALAGHGPAAVFGWAEEARALSSRLPTVVPPADPAAAQLLQELRQARAELAAQTVAGTVDPALRGRCGELERLIRQRSWHLAGTGPAGQPATLKLVQEQLAPATGTLVVYLIRAGRLHCLVADPRRRAVHDLGPAAPAIELRRRLRADFDILANRNVPEHLRAGVQAASQHALSQLDGLLLGPIRRLLGAGPLLLVPGAELQTVPWTLLPTTSGRPVTVVPSATSWLAARKRAALPADPGVVLAAGPRIERGAEELGLVAAEWPHSSMLTGQQATAAGVRAAASQTDVLHVAAHGVHEPDNPLFSHLEMADGPLFGHELDLLPQLPTHVVLSACELGLSETRPGSETLGMTAALLHGGAGSVVAGVAQVADTAACAVGAAHHAGLRRGLDPATALCAAIASNDSGVPAPLVCFGAGW